MTTFSLVKLRGKGSFILLLGFQRFSFAQKIDRLCSCKKGTIYMLVVKMKYIFQLSFMAQHKNIS